jgi:hypothetical protein
MATIRPISTGPVNNSKPLANPAGSCTVRPSNQGMRMKIDWQAVRDHKMFLYSMTDSPSAWQRTNAWGLIDILHNLQDAEVDSGRATEQEVYGRDGRNAFAEMVKESGEEFDRFEETMADQFGQE